MHVTTLGVDDDPALTKLATVPGYPARIERIFKLRLDTFDWNCPQHIAPRFTEQEVRALTAPLREPLAQLEKENRVLPDRASRDAAS